MISPLPTIFSIGELLIDRFPNYDRLGGAPCNFIHHASLLGNNAHLISALGKDSVATTIRESLKTFGISSQFIQENTFQSGQVQVHFEQGEATYSIQSPSAWDAISYSETLQEKVSKAQIFCFSTLSQREEVSRNTTYKLLNGLSDSTLVLFDVNLRPPFFNRSIIERSLNYAHYVKLNEFEYDILQQLFDVEELATFLLRQFGVKGIIKTLGAKGSRWISNEFDVYVSSQSLDTSNGDSVGVGDAFFACFAHHLIRKKDPKRVLENANRYAGYVATQQGAIMKVPEDIITKVS